MKSNGIDFFQRLGNHYLILMDPFSGLNMFQKMKKTAAKDVVAKLKKWFTLFGVTILISCDNAPPFSYKAFEAFCDLQPHSPYHPISSKDRGQDGG